MREEERQQKGRVPDMFDGIILKDGGVPAKRERASIDIPFHLTGARPEQPSSATRNRSGHILLVSDHAFSLKRSRVSR